MPTANNTARNMMLRPNMAPTPTIRPENTTSNRKVLNLLACGCHVTVLASFKAADSSNLSESSISQRPDRWRGFRRFSRAD